MSNFRYNQNQMLSNRPSYSCVLSCQAFDLEWGWSWPCCDRDQCLVSIITRQCTFEKQQGLYHNKVTLSLTPVERLGNQVHNCKINCRAQLYWHRAKKIFKPKGKKKEKKERQFKIRATFPNPLFAYSGLLSVKPINLLKNDNFLLSFILSK